MRARDYTWTIALCASLTAHAALLEWRARVYIADHRVIRFAGWDRSLVVNTEPEQPVVEEVGQLGDSKGTGYAADASPGDLELLARKGDQDQSFLSRDPEGPGQIGTPPSPSLVPPGENGENGTAEAMTPPDEPPLFGVQPNQEQPTPPVKAPTAAAPTAASAPPPRDGPGPNPRAEKPDAKPTPADASPPPRPPAARQSTPNVILASRAGRPGPNMPAADPAPQGDSESDPFSIVGSLEFRKGSTKVRMGRNHKITRPRLSWDTQYDFMSMSSATVVLDLKLDETGKVVLAEVIKSSGSASIDQPCRLAAYEWWFEPAKDANGQPTKDEIKFTIKFF